MQRREKEETDNVRVSAGSQWLKIRKSIALRSTHGSSILSQSTAGEDGGRETAAGTTTT